MAASESITVESDWLASEELRRILEVRREEFPGLTVSVGKASHRGLDPTVTAAIISGAVSLLTPFVIALAQRIFAKEPKAAVRLSDGDESKDVVIRASLPAERREAMVGDAIASGAVRVRITIDLSPG